MEEDVSVFKWVCLVVAVVALAGLGWMLNDIRLQVKGLGEKADTVLKQSEQVTRQLDDQIPRILKQTEEVVGQLNRHLPIILAETQKASATLDRQLTAILGD